MESVLAAHKSFMNDYRNDSAAVNKVRQRAILGFKVMSLPSSKDEDFKYTNLKRLSELFLRYGLELKPAATDLLELKKLLEKNLIGLNKVVFLNGRLLPELSLLTRRGEYEVKEQLAAPSALPEIPLLNLNRAFMSSPLEVNIIAEASLKAPLWFVNISSEGKVSNTSVQINMGANSSAEVVEAFFSLDQKPCFVNAVTKINVNQGASLRHFVFEGLGEQDGMAHSLFLELSQDATLSSLNLAKSYVWSRNNVLAQLKGAGASVSLFGLNLPNEDQFIDHCLKVIHAAPQTKSKQLYKGVLSGKAKSIFNGKITIERRAKGAAAEQLNKNIICDRNAEAITRPQLEVHADDVKATHGATIGKINPEELFYLESRGLSLVDARRLLTEGFVREVLELGLQGELRAWALNQLNINELVGKDVV
mgnify:CR=1 FL=1